MMVIDLFWCNFLLNHMGLMYFCMKKNSLNLLK